RRASARCRANRVSVTRSCTAHRARPACRSSPADVDTRDTPEQAELRRAARQLARELGPTTVADLDDATRTKRLAAAVRDAGWLELRHDGGDGAPLASGVEAAIVADALGAGVADVAFTGPVLAADLARRAGVEPAEDAVVVFDLNLLEPATGAGVAIDVDREHLDAAYVLVPNGTAYGLGQVRPDTLDTPHLSVPANRAGQRA